MFSKKAFYIKYPTPKQHIYRGVCLPGEPFCSDEKDYANIRNFQVRHDDIAILSYLRTGSRWTTERVAWIINCSNEELLANTTNIDRVKHLEFAVPTNNADLLASLPVSEPRLYSSHLRREFGPAEIEKAKIIIPYRNPKDNVVSLYHHFQLVKSFGSYSGPWEDFLAGYMDGTVMWGSYHEWLKSWWPLHDLENVMFVKYEDSIKDPAQMVRKMGKFLEVSLTEEQVQKVVEKTSFATMKNSVGTNFSRNPIFAEIYNPKVHESVEFIRKGEVGQWKDYFTVRQNEDFDDFIKQNFGGMDLDFQYKI